MKPIPIRNFKGLSDEEIIVKADQIITSMTGNTKFPDATARVTKVQTARDEFATALVDAKGGGKTKTALKDAKRKALEKALKELALYVQLACDGDLVTMLTSGFDAWEDGEQSKDPGAPKGFTVEPGLASGMFKVSVDAHENIKVYVFEYALVPESGEPIWKVLIGKRTRIIKGLTPGKQYMIRSALQGSNEDLVYSEIIYKYVS